MILIEIYGTTGVNARFISLLVVQILLKYIDFPDQYQYLGQSHFILRENGLYKTVPLKNTDAIKVSRREIFKVIFPVNSRFWPNDDQMWTNFELVVKHKRHKKHFSLISVVLDNFFSHYTWNWICLVLRRYLIKVFIICFLTAVCFIIVL